MLLDEIEVTRNLAATVNETIFVNVPQNAQRVKWFAKHITTAAVTNSLFPRFDAKTTDGDFSTDGTALFNINGAAAGTSTQGENFASMACNRLKWSIQANAGAATQFYLRVKFYDV